ncbi:STAS domain-containing protein [Actinoplanes sp. TBRC 11911]|uniref:STAS domain-containing protein n=1 Tax=Actinoplanes sp. TBRC 11911 TaxID=2729386 RepID=UPI00145F8A3C|nr:STAS domain-containing protein [Actinoplanes sp. TBRC 11911]
MTAAITTSTSADGDITVVRVEADLTEALRDVLALAGTSRHLVLDLTGVPTLDPEGLGLLVRARQQLRQDGRGWLCLAAPSRFVLTVLHIMRLETAFPVFADRFAAVTWLRSGTDVPTPFWAG